MARLLVNNLSVFRNQRCLVRDFSHQFKGGEIYALVGDNGSGKTTLLKMLAGLLTCESDKIFIAGEDVTTLSNQRRALAISFLLQHSSEQPYCTVKSRIAHGLMPTLGYDHFLDIKSEQQIEEIARSLNIAHLLNHKLAKISGGEQRLAHIAKCLIGTSTKILLLDEPSVFLDFRQQNNLMRNLKEQAQNDRLIIFSSHDKEFIRRCADFIIAINDQQIEISGNSY